MERATAARDGWYGATYRMVRTATSTEWPASIQLMAICWNGSIWNGYVLAGGMSRRSEGGRDEQDEGEASVTGRGVGRGSESWKCTRSRNPEMELPRSRRGVRSSTMERNGSIVYTSTIPSPPVRSHDVSTPGIPPRACHNPPCKRRKLKIHVPGGHATSCKQLFPFISTTFLRDIDPRAKHASLSSPSPSSLSRLDWVGAETTEVGAGRRLPGSRWGVVCSDTPMVA